MLQRARIAAIVGPAVQQARSAIVLAVGQALLVGLLAGGVSSLLDLPAPSAVGFFAGVASLFPHVGLTLGAIPMLLLTLGFRSLFAAIVLLVATLALQIVDSMVDPAPRRPPVGRGRAPGPVGGGARRLLRVRHRWGGLRHGLRDLRPRRPRAHGPREPRRPGPVRRRALVT